MPFILIIPFFAIPPPFKNDKSSLQANTLLDQSKNQLISTLPIGGQHVCQLLESLVSLQLPFLHFVFEEVLPALLALLQDGLLLVQVALLGPAGILHGAEGYRVDQAVGEVLRVSHFLVGARVSGKHILDELFSF